MLRLNDILDKVTAYNPDADVDLIKKAYVYSAKVHGGQVRKSGEPYLMHPLAVADLLAELRLDEASICTGLLHDTVEDTLATLDDLNRLFGEDITAMVDGVTKLSQIKFRTKEEKQAENFRKMLVAMSKDIRVLMVKLCDRLHNMRTLEHMRPEKQKTIATETMEIYAPLANRLGMSWIKLELEELSFRYMKPVEYQKLTDELRQTKKERERYIHNTQSIIERSLTDGGVARFDVSGRPKHLWSIHKKMAGKGVPFSEVHDLIAFRVLVDTVGQCYETLGHIHTLWRPIPGRFKDYIAMPKPNGYQSLHTTVIGPDAERLEVQIRTRDMHEIAEAGIAAHWKYKESGGSQASAQTKGEAQFAWLRQLLDWQRDLDDPNEFLDSVKYDLFQDEVFIFTPNGDVRELPRGSTSVDFAFAIHSDVGMRCAGAKVNGRMVPLKTPLKTGDTVEIITAKNRQPNKDWLDFVKTSRARTKIRAALRQIERERSAEIGRELLDREFKRFGQSIQKYLKSKAIEKAFKDSKYKTLDEVLVAVGYGKLGPQMVVERVLPEDVIKREPQEPKRKSRISQLFDKVAKRASSGIKLEGIEDIMVHYARCCAPVKGDDIIGFVTRGRGLTVHRRDCPKVLNLDPERRVDVSWDEDTTFQRPIFVTVVSDDRGGMLAELGNAFTKASVNISEAKCRALGDGQAVNTFRCGVADLKQLNKVMRQLEQIKGVHSVERARGHE